MFELNHCVNYFLKKKQQETGKGSHICTSLFWGSIAFCMVILLSFGPVKLFAADQVERIVDEEAAIVLQGQKSQAKIDVMAEETQELLQEYRNLRRQHDNLVIYNDNLADMIQSQENEMVLLEKQIEEIQVTQREIVPLILRMLDSLEEFVAADIPFLIKERQSRVEGVKGLMRRADVEIPEKYRQIMAAYQTEADYGRTMETYQGELVLDGQIRSVEFLRIGRLVLAYQTPDRSESGYWDARRQTWIPLEAKHNHAIRQGIRIASRQAAPELIQVPVVISETIP